MKLQTTKKLFAFIIIMLFSSSFLHAQCLTCKINHVSMYRCGRCGTCEFPDPYGLCNSPGYTLSFRRCIPQSQVQKYEAMCWQTCGFYIIQNKNQNSNKRIQNSPLIKAAAERNIVLKKVNRR